MKLSSLLAMLKDAPLIASVQASPKSPVDQPEVLWRLARASLEQGVKVLRLEGVKDIRFIKPATAAPTIGLLKRTYPNSDVYITPAAQDVDALIEQGCEVVAFDATSRTRPKKDTVASLIERIHRRKTLAMADCDTLENALLAAEAGADLIGTTLAGYTPDRPATDGPDLELVRQIVANTTVPVIAEGRYTQRWQVEAALRIGAVGVVVGGALNDPVKQTRNLFPRMFALTSTAPRDARPHVGAVDIGGTWLRFGVFTDQGELVSSEREANPPTRAARIEWIRAQIEKTCVAAVGVGTGGIVDPATGEVWTAKEYLMHDHIGIVFSEETLGVPTFAHGDGHAQAWGHACVPKYAGLRVATLAIGTGVGAGFVQNGKIWAGRRGEYPRVNDLPTAAGRSYEELLGGIHLTPNPTEEQKATALVALEGAVDAMRHFYFPDVMVMSGGVGLSPWVEPHLARLNVVPSPFGHDAGLFGAAALALYPDYR